MLLLPSKQPLALALLPLVSAGSVFFSVVMLLLLPEPLLLAADVLILFVKD